MKHVNGNLWDFHQDGPVCITTNGVIKKDNTLVMGAGIALQARERFPSVPGILADLVRVYGNCTFYLTVENLFSFPTKNNWWEKSDIDLITRSSKQLVDITDRMGFPRVYLPRPGCANGQLRWPVVNKVIGDILDDRFIVVMQ